MWREEENFIFRMIPDITHYLVFLCLGLITNHMVAKSLLFQNTRRIESLLASFFMAVAFCLSLRWHFQGFIISITFLTALVFSTRSPIYAVSVTIIFYICRPWEVVEANEWWLQIPRWCIWVWLLSWLRNKSEGVTESPCFLIATRGFFLIFTLGTWAGLTIIFSGDPNQSFQFYVDTLLRALILVVVIGLSVQKQKDVRFLCYSFAIGVATLSIFSIWRYHGFDQPLQIPFIREDQNFAEKRLEAVGSLGNSNDIAAVVLIPLGFLWPVLFSKKENVIKWAIAVAISTLLMTAILASQSRGALIAAVAQCGVYFVSRAHKPARLGLLILIVIGFLTPLANRVMGRDMADLDASTNSRMNYYITGLRMALYSPIWGQGFGRYPFEFERFSLATVHEWGHRTAHSSWILVLSETGVIGFILFSAIHLRMFKICWEVRKTLPGLLLALSGYSITIVFLSHSWLMFPWILFSLIELAKITIERETNHAKKRKVVL